MEKRFVTIPILAVLIYMTLPGSNCFAQSVHSPDTSEKKSLQKFLKKIANAPKPSGSETPIFFGAMVDLQDNGTHEAIVYLISGERCGSGGCPMFVLTPKDSSYSIITQTSVTQRPIRILATKTNGWHDIAVQVSGGGIDGYEAKLSFDGKAYPSNPTVRPARRLVEKTAGVVAIPDLGKGIPVY